jgi:hypothetical protein
VNGFLDHLYTRLGTASNYSAIADLHTLRITTAHAKPQSFILFPSRCLVTALNNGDSSASVLTPLPFGLLLTTELIAPAVLVITSRHGPHRKHPVLLLLLSCPLPQNVFTEPLPRNGHYADHRNHRFSIAALLCCGRYLATGLYATIFMRKNCDHENADFDILTHVQVSSPPQYENVVFGLHGCVRMCASSLALEGLDVFPSNYVFKSLFTSITVTVVFEFFSCTPQL